MSPGYTPPNGQKKSLNRIPLSPSRAKDEPAFPCPAKGTRDTQDDPLTGPYLHEHAESSFKEISEA